MTLNCGEIGFPSKLSVANAGRALHNLLHKDELAVLKQKNDADEKKNEAENKTTDFAGARESDGDSHVSLHAALLKRTLQAWRGKMVGKERRANW